jgi:hypothetical protein
MGISYTMTNEKSFFLNVSDVCYPYSLLVSFPSSNMNGASSSDFTCFYEKYHPLYCTPAATAFDEPCSKPVSKTGVQTVINMFF